MSEESDILKTARSILEQSRAPYLCETCWVFVASGEEHQCDPEERAMAMLRATSPTYTDPHRRAKGYGVR